MNPHGDIRPRRRSTEDRAAADEAARTLLATCAVLLSGVLLGTLSLNLGIAHLSDQEAQVQATQAQRTPTWSDGIPRAPSGPALLPLPEPGR